MSWIVLAVCLLLSFLLSGLEAAVLSASVLRARHRATGGGDRRATVIDTMLGHRDRLLAAVSLANAGVGLGAFVIVTLALVGRFGDAGYGVAFAIWLPVYLIVFELVPKSLFRRFPYRMLQNFAPLLRIVDLSFGTPLRLAAPLRRLAVFNDELRPAESRREDFRQLTEAAGKYGALTGSEADLIYSVLDFQKLTVADVTIPLAETISVPADMPAAQWLELARAKRLDQLPTRGANGEITGLIDVLQILREGKPDPSAPAAAHIVPVRAIHASGRAVEALAELRRSRADLARVFSERGGTLGIVTADDILHRLFVASATADSSSGANTAVRAGAIS